MVRRFLMPAWLYWIAAIKAASPDTVVEMDSDGYNAELLLCGSKPGSTRSRPWKWQPRGDIVAYRRQYGDQIAFRGGIDKRALARGGANMRAELKRVVPPPATGGYIPSCDHGVPPDIVWPDRLYAPAGADDRMVRMNAMSAHDRLAVAPGRAN